MKVAILSQPRYAIYFTPQPISPLALFGAAVLGYDSASKADVSHLALDGILPVELIAATATPRRYGFHATLVAPFYLAGQSERELLTALEKFCDTAVPLPLGLLRPALLGSFIALIPETPSPHLDNLARRCVEFFDPMRAPLTAFDLARLDNGNLSLRQRTYLERWGYPYVFEEFRLHMTLTGSLIEADRERFLSAITEIYCPLADYTLELDAISLMRQENRDSRFEVIVRDVMRGVIR